MSSKEKINITPPQAEPSLPEHVPTLTFATALGEKYGNIEFDYEAFNSRAKQMGLYDEGISELSIEVIEGSRSASTARYHIPTNTIELKTNKGLDSNLSHELQHAIDQREGLLDNGRRRAIGVAAFKLMNLNSLIAASSAAAAIAGSGAAEIMTQSAGVTGDALLGGYLWGYRFNPEERRARKAAKNKFPPVLTVEKQSKQK